MRARPDLLSIGALGTIYAAGGGLNALMDAMNRAYEVHETRPLLARIAVAVVLTVFAGTGVVVAFVALVAGAGIIQQVASQQGLGTITSTLLVLLRWPAMFVLLSAAAALIFRLAPNVHTPWRWTLVGGVVFAVGWLVMTAAFALYVGHASYGATYGPVAGAVVVMLWFYLTAIVLVAAAELVALLAVEREPELLRARRAETAPEAARAAVDDGRRLVGDLERKVARGAESHAQRSDGG
jgi:membrane protein